MDYAVPLLLLPFEKLGTGFFWEIDDELYLITNRHNLLDLTHEVVKPNGTAESFPKEDQIDRIEVGIPQALSHLEQDGNFPSIYSFSIDNVTVIETSDLDVAAIPVDGLNPNEYDLSIFDHSTSLSTGDRANVESYSITRTNRVSVAAQAIASCPLNVRSNSETKWVELSEKPEQGSSGSPVFTSHGVAGVLFITFTLRGNKWGGYVPAERVENLIR